MDWIQWYLVGVWTVGLAIVSRLHGTPKNDNWSIGGYLFGTLVCLPYYGRVLGWW